MFTEHPAPEPSKAEQLSFCPVVQKVLRALEPRVAELLDLVVTTLLREQDGPAPRA